MCRVFARGFAKLRVFFQQSVAIIVTSTACFLWLRSMFVFPASTNVIIFLIASARGGRRLRNAPRTVRWCPEYHAFGLLATAAPVASRTPHRARCAHTKPLPSNCPMSGMCLLHFLPSFAQRPRIRVSGLGGSCGWPGAFLRSEDSKDAKNQKTSKAEAS